VNSCHIQIKAQIAGRQQKNEKAKKSSLDEIIDKNSTWV